MQTQPPTPQKNRVIELKDSDDEANSDDEESPANSAMVKHQKPRSEPFERGEDGWPRFPSPKIHPASALFAEKPPADLPAFPSEKTTLAMQNNETINEAFGSREAVTYHPLLTVERERLQ